MGKKKSEQIKKIYGKKGVINNAITKNLYGVSEFAEMIGISRNALYVITRGGSTSTKTAKAICKKLKMKFEDLFEVK